MSTTATRGNMAESAAVRADRTIFEGLIEALADKHSQLDINFHNVNLKLPSMQVGVELNGSVTLSVHMRELSDEEKKALAEKNVGMLATPK